MKKKEEYQNRRKADTFPLKECIEDFLKATKIKGKYEETKLVSSWEKIIGKPIASRTTEIFIRNRILYLRLSSAPLKQELSMAKTKLVEMINRETEEDLISDILFL